MSVVGWKCPRCSVVKTYVDSSRDDSSRYEWCYCNTCRDVAAGLASIEPYGTVYKSRSTESRNGAAQGHAGADTYSIGHEARDWPSARRS